MYRLSYFFVLFSYILLVSLFLDVSKSIAKKGGRMTFFFLLIIFISFKARIYFVANSDTPMYVHYYPYTNIFNEEIVSERECIDKLY